MRRRAEGQAADALLAAAVARDRSGGAGGAAAAASRGGRRRAGSWRRPRRGWRRPARWWERPGAGPWRWSSSGTRAWLFGATKSEEAIQRLTALLATLGPAEVALRSAPCTTPWGWWPTARRTPGPGNTLPARPGGRQGAGRSGRVSSAYNNLGILAARQELRAPRSGWRGCASRPRGSREGLARAYNNLGTLYGEMGDLPRAARFLAESIHVRERSGHAGTAVGYASLGEVFLKQGHAPEAREHLERAIALRRRAGPRLPAARRLADARRASPGPSRRGGRDGRGGPAARHRRGIRPPGGVATRVLGEARAARGRPRPTRCRLGGGPARRSGAALGLARAYAARARRPVAG
ncbi:MAG: tetratricopeptide repeat protein [bacterium]